MPSVRSSQVGAAIFGPAPMGPAGEIADDTGADRLRDGHSVPSTVTRLAPGPIPSPEVRGEPQAAIACSVNSPRPRWPVSALSCALHGDPPTSSEAGGR